LLWRSVTVISLFFLSRSIGTGPPRPADCPRDRTLRVAGWASGQAPLFGY